MTYSLIPSAAYIDMELAAEFGRIPPSFLPVGHRRLYDLQLETLDNEESVYLTLPQSFEIPVADAAALKNKGVHVLEIPDGISLGRSIQYALDLIGRPLESIRILHGDTLIPDTPLEKMDIVVVGPPPGGYDWGRIALDSSAPVDVLAGYFALSNPDEFRRCLSLADGKFTQALSLYHKKIELQNIVVDTWLDFGHLQPFYRARCKVRTQRSFNEIHLNYQRIRKTGENRRKIVAEADWFQILPAALRLYTPAFLGCGTSDDGQPWYELEYLPLPSLHELFVFGDLSDSSWRNIFRGCVQFLEDCSANTDRLAVIQAANVRNFREFVSSKTFDRLEPWLLQKGHSLKTQWTYGGNSLPSIGEVIELTAQEIDEDGTQYQSIMHGDFCFTNVFFDFRTMRIRTIDPRGGMDDNRNSIMGDWRYDLAKISHSLIGCYDLILADRFQLIENSPLDVTILFMPSNGIRCAQEQFKAIHIKGLNPKSKQIMAIVIHLFLSMVPLHNDRPDRQNAFFANALRLYYEYFVDL